AIFLIFKGYIVSIILSLIFVFIYSFILINTSVGEKTIKPVVMGIAGISVLCGSIFSCLKIRKKGIINGVIVGALYFLSLYILSSIVFCGFSFNISSIIMILVGILLGGIGGVLGVNFGK
ncbi:MAG: TIGR04086 family membrane protein, partial [Clostridia bacterium]|nr:TIGR04086 family membrane protein [Clostridia bacterium]